MSDSYEFDMCSKGIIKHYNYILLFLVYRIVHGRITQGGHAYVYCRIFILIWACRLPCYG